MKKFEKLEPSLANLINVKRAKRKSNKASKKLINRALRRKLNTDYNSGKEITRQNLGYEF